MKYKITILITVYNAKKYFIKCANSLVNQTCDKDLYEVIVVDDGSTDGVSQICDEYAEKYENFKVIHQENSGGPSLGRNKGIDLAKSNYIFFCDVDDYFNNEAIERLIRYIDKWHPDVLLAKMGTENRDGISDMMFSNTYEKVDIYNSLIWELLGPWKLFNINFLKDNNLYFPIDVTLEDVVFVSEAYFLAKKVSIVSDYTYYMWNLRDDGTNLTSHITDTSHNWGKINKRLDSLKLINEILEKYNDTEKNQKGISLKFMDILYNNLSFFIRNNCSQEELNNLYDLSNKLINEKFISFLPIRRFLLLIYFSNNHNLEEIKEFYSKLLKEKIDIFQENKKFYLDENKTLNITKYFNQNNLSVSYLNDIILKQKNKLHLNFSLYSNIDDNYSLLIVPNNNLEYSLKYELIRKTLNKSIYMKKSLKECYYLFDSHFLDVSININDLIKQSKKYLKKSTDDNIVWSFLIVSSSEENQKIKIYNNTKHLFEFTYVFKDNIIIPDLEKNKTICLRQVNSKTNISNLSYAVNKSRPIKNRIIFTLLSLKKYDLLYDICDDIYNDNFKFKYSFTKKYIKCYSKGKVIKIDNYMYENIIRRIIKKIKLFKN